MPDEPQFNSLVDWIAAWNRHSHTGPPCAECERLDVIGHALGMDVDDDDTE